MTEIQKTWEDRITRAVKIREDWEKQFKVELGRRYFEGEQNPGYPENEWITVNKIFSHLQSQLPMLYSVDPYFYIRLNKTYKVDPETIALYEQRGTIRQSNLNYLKGELKLKEKARMGIHSAHFAYGVAKTHFKADNVKHEHAGEPILDEEGNEIRDEEGNPQVYPETIPTNKRYVIDYIDPDDMLWDEDAGPLEDSWKWIAQRICMTREEAEGDKRFSQAALKTAKPQQDKKNLVNKIIQRAFTKSEQEDKTNDLLVFWEIYDLKRKEWLMISIGAEKPIIKPKPVPHGTECHPYSFLRFILREKSPYPIPPVYPGIDPQKEYNLSRSRLLTHRKRFNRKYTVIRQMLEDPDQDLAHLETGDDGAIINVQSHGAVEPIKDAPLDQMSIQEIMLLNTDMVELLGSPDATRGIAAADSATEASILDTRLEVKEGDRLSMVVDFVLDIARKLDQLVQVHIDRDQAVKITGPQGEYWSMVKQEDYEAIEGEFEYAVNVGATQPRLPNIERSQWIAFLSQVVIPFPHILTAPSVMKRMAEMFHIEDEAALEEFRQLGLKMLSGQMPMPGGQGSQAGVPQDNPIASIMGAALGDQGGNNNGGGSPVSSGAQ